MAERPTSPTTTEDDTPEAFYAVAAALREKQHTKAAAAHAATGALLAIAAARDPETGDVRCEDAGAVEATRQLDLHDAWPVFTELLKKFTDGAPVADDEKVAWIGTLEQDLVAGGAAQTG
ncbi:hypothetical protein [Streptomyces sp. NPDC089919]|uniref:hypothetical protein n=1 Tax=Streptomyces sp. NPDC089919 TaxID=3155188 RepID=UPI003425A04F